MVVIYAVGSNSSGQLGIGHNEDVSVPKPVVFGANNIGSVTQVKAGGNHTLVLSSGLLYVAGDPASGACGLVSGSGSPQAQFWQLMVSDEATTTTKPRAIRLCAASWESSFIVQEDEHGLLSEVYSFGTGQKGELGVGDLLFRSSNPQRIKNFPPPGLEVVDLAASVTHAIAVLSNGDVYGWGNGRRGQLGQPEGMIYAPRKISGIDFKVVRAVCGREFTYLLGAPQEGIHTVLGTDKWNVKSSAPPSVPGWKDVGASWGSIFVLQQAGNLLSWGRDDHGQLAPSGLPPLLQIAVGSEHVVAHTKAGDVLAWGWGEHGNCGPNTVDGDVRGRWNTIVSTHFLPPSTRIHGIGAGCATSWIYIGD